MAPDSVQALADPHEVDIAAIERELEALWRSAGDEDSSVLRATAFNLVYVARKSADDPSELLAKLSLSHPPSNTPAPRWWPRRPGSRLTVTSPRAVPSRSVPR